MFSEMTEQCEFQLKGQIMTEKNSITQPMTVSAWELAYLLGVSVRHIRRLDSCGALPVPVRIGRCVRWRSEEIKCWLEAGAPDRSSWEVVRGQDK